ncbi:MAG TPA: hypothetical protein VFF70_00905, partial [Anaerolineae bacterium]|nr:hypothetical protein [Anaerolineae bacterium]
GTISSVPDTTTINRLTRDQYATHSIGPQATTDLTGTNGTLVAVDLLLSLPYYATDLPLVTK